MVPINLSAAAVLCGALRFNTILSLCRLLITFTNSLVPDQDQQNVGPDLDPYRLTLWQCSWKNFSKKLILKKVSSRQKLEKITQNAKS